MPSNLKVIKLRKLLRIFPFSTSSSLFTWKCKICPWEISILPGLVGTHPGAQDPDPSMGAGEVRRAGCGKGLVYGVFFGGEGFWGAELALSEHS